MSINVVSNGRWGYGALQEPGSSQWIIQPMFFRRHRYPSLIQKGDSYGVTVDTYDQVNALGLERGYLKLYGRNTLQFVQSRSARKHGYQTTDYFYLLKQEMNQIRPFFVALFNVPPVVVNAHNAYRAGVIATKLLKENGFVPSEEWPNTIHDL